MSAAAKKPSVWSAFTQPAAWTMFFFGFSSGLPFLLVAGTLAYWLKDNGIELKEITLIASAGMRRIGRRRRRKTGDEGGDEHAQGREHAGVRPMAARPAAVEGGMLGQHLPVQGGFA